MSSRKRFRAAPVLERLFARWPGGRAKPTCEMLALELHELAHHAHLFRCMPSDGEPMYSVSDQVSDMLRNACYGESPLRRLQAEVFACLISEGVAARLGMSSGAMRRFETRVRRALWQGGVPALEVNKRVRKARLRFKDSPTVHRWVEEIYKGLTTQEG